MSNRLIVDTNLMHANSRIVGMIETDESVMVLFERAQIEIPGDRNSTAATPGAKKADCLPEVVSISADLQRLESDLWDEFRAIKLQLTATSD
jgi:hypothetical protein